MADHSKDYSTGPVEWIYPHQAPAPRGVKLFLLNEGGVAVMGEWRDDGGFVAWQHLFKRNRDQEARAAVLKCEAGMLALIDCLDIWTSR